MTATAYYKDEDIYNGWYPDVTTRHIGHLVRNVKPIDGYRAIVDKESDRTFSIVKRGYRLIDHREVIDTIDSICEQFPEYGTPTKEVWLSNHGGRMKTRWTFTDIDFEIGKLPDGSPDTIHPTLESFSSYDTSLAQRILLGGFRVICTNGMVVGKILSDYKRRHTASLDLTAASLILEKGMADYSKVANLWLSYKERNAFLEEVNCYEVLGFNKAERRSVERQIKEQGKVIRWDDEPENREVEINAWDLMQIYTEEASHRIFDITRRSKILDKIATSFKRGKA